MDTIIATVDHEDGSSWDIVEPVEACRRALHHRAFRLRHRLDRDPLFSIESLLGVARSAERRAGDVYLDAGDVLITDRWGKIAVPELPVDEVIRRIEHAGAWIVMEHVETDPRYARVLGHWAAAMREIAGDGASLLTTPEMLVFVTSPGRTTPFHFDAQVNVLAQVPGRKRVWVCDPADRSIVSETDIENYYGISITAGSFSPRAREAAPEFLLEPGDAVHIPAHAAHWVENLDEVSVSLSLNFELPRSHGADIYLANYHLRRLGAAPRPPGRSRLVDTLKATTMRTARAVKRTVRPGAHTADTPG